MSAAIPTAPKGNKARLSSETLHASTVALDGRAVMISGPSGSGKSDLALRLLDRGFVLVSDDQTIVRRVGDRLIASAPPTIAGKLEIRGVGIVDMETVEDMPVALLVGAVSFLTTRAGRRAAAFASSGLACVRAGRRALRLRCGVCPSGRRVAPRVMRFGIKLNW